MFQTLSETMSTVMSNFFGNTIFSFQKSVFLNKNICNHYSNN